MRWCIILGFFAAVEGVAQQVLSLEEAILLAKTNNRGLQLSSAGVDAEEASATEARSQLYPGLSFLGGYTRIEEGAFRLSTTNQPQPLAVGNVVVDNFVFRLGLRQPLFTGFRLSGLSEAADLRLTASRQDYAMAEQDLVFGVTASYWSLYQVRRVEYLAKENVARLEAYRLDTERLMEGGLATKNDLLRIGVQLSNSRIALLEAENDAILAAMRLNTLIGRPSRDHIVLSSVPQAGSAWYGGKNSPSGENIDELVEEAVHNRPDLLAAETRSRAASQMVRAARGGWWPQIELTANYQYNNPNSRYQPITPEFLGTWDVGVSMLFDLWNWGETGSKVEQSEAGQRRADIYRMQLMDNVVLEVSEAALNLKRSREKTSVAVLAVSQADENLRATADKYHAGSATSTELLDAEVDLYKAQVQLSGAEVEYALAQAGLHRSLGGASEATAAE